MKLMKRIRILFAAMTLNEQQEHVRERFGISRWAYAKAGQCVHVWKGITTADEFAAPRSKDAIIGQSEKPVAESYVNVPSDGTFQSKVSDRYNSPEFGGGLHPGNVHELVAFLPGGSEYRKRRGYA